MLTIKEVREHNLIPESILNTLPDKCKCGSEILISESLYEVQCSNPKCIYKIVERTKKFINKLNLKGWSDLEIEQLVTKYEMITPFQILIIDQLELEELAEIISNIKTKVTEIKELKQKEIHLWEMVEMASIPYISTIAYELFGNYDSIEKAYNDVDAEQLSLVSEKLGINEYEPTVMAVLIYEQLLESREELQFAETLFTLKKYTENPIKIVIASSISNFINKYEYLEYLNARYGESFGIVLESKVKLDTHVVVVDNFVNEDENTKLRVARRINEEYIKECIENNIFQNSDIGKENENNKLFKIGEKIAVVNSSELVERLDKVYDIINKDNRHKIMEEVMNTLIEEDEDDFVTEEEAEEFEQNNLTDKDVEELTDEEFDELYGDEDDD